MEAPAQVYQKAINIVKVAKILMMMIVCRKLKNII